MLKNNEIETVEDIDLQRFMGDWHILADIATPFDKHAKNPIERYTLNEDGTISTTYLFDRNGKQKQMNARAFVVADSGNAIWGMQFFWPIKSEYKIAYVDQDYGTAIVARDKRDYVWIMSRTKKLPAASFESLLVEAEAIGYSRDELRIHHRAALKAVISQ